MGGKMASTPRARSASAVNFSNFVRFFGWSVLAIMLVFLANNYLTFVGGLPGAGLSWSEDGGALRVIQTLLYPAAVVLALAYVAKSADRSLRTDAEQITGINTFFIRAAFWCVLIVGLADMVVSFLRVEDMLGSIAGDQLAQDLGRSQFRGVYFHLPLLAAGVIIAMFTRTLGFYWLALLIVAAELGIVILRFVFSYEQAFLSDLVRFWYGALFLFASAYTLIEEGHVRVDVFYASFSTKTKAVVNAVCTVLLGIPFCWTILIVGMGQKTSIINSPTLNFEVTQSGFGMYVKYMMAGFLGVFAISMMIQFVAYLMDAVADYRGEPGSRQPAEALAH
jgi:TRAP-type mannitol/chloroaromatic compound transport system permease small subunit